MYYIMYVMYVMYVILLIVLYIIKLVKLNFSYVYEIILKNCGRLSFNRIEENILKFLLSFFFLVNLACF